MSEKIKLSPSGFRANLGIEETRYSDADKRRNNPQLNLGRFGRSESMALLNSIAVPQDKTAPAFSGDVSQIISYLNPTSNNVGKRARSIEQLSALAPEINQASIILPSSIMSPNDMQDGAFTFVFNGVDALDNDPDLSNAVQNLYSDYFNNVLKLGTLTYDWLREALYRSGAKAVLLVPSSIHSAIKNRSKEDIARDYVAGFEDFNTYCNTLNRDDDYLYSGMHVGWKDIFDGEKLDDVIMQTSSAMESLVTGIPDEYRSPYNRSARTIAKQEYDAAMEAMIVNMRTRLEEGDLIKISENPEIVRFNLARVANAAKRTDTALDRKYNANDRANLPIENIISLDTFDAGTISDDCKCAMLDIPTEAVIPIHVPGVPNQHLGYFIIIDENGQPLTYREDTGNINNFIGGTPIDTNTAESFAAMFGTSSDVYRINTQTNVASAQNVIFNHFLDRYVKSRLKNLIPGDELELSQFNAIATTMFYRMLKNKKTTLVYAPPRLLHYLAFDYRPDGTGKPKPEDISFILSLRTTLLMANVIGSVNDAVDHKRIEFDVGEAASSKNVEQIMETIRSMYISRSQLAGSLDPGEILNNMSTNAVTIVPKNIQGLQNFSVDVSNTNSQSAKVDNDTIEFLTSALIQVLEVPPSALNQLAEAEFSRSIATNNLFFAKRISTYQEVTNKFITDLIRAYTRFDSKFKKSLIYTVQNNGKSRVRDKVPKEVAKLAKNNPNKRSTIDQMIHAIMNGVETQLPKTNIVVDKAQFEEIRNYISNIDELSSRIFDNELVPQDNQKASDGMNAMRAYFKRKCLLDMIGRVGAFSMAEVPDGDDIDAQDHIDLVQQATNYGAAVSAYSEVINRAQEESSDTMGGGDYGGGSDFGTGGDDDDEGFGL